MSSAYSSLFAPFISGLVATKRAVGYSYESAEFKLHDFDRYAALHPAYQSLSRELVRGWAKAKDGENPAAHRTRLSPLRELGKYMQSIGVADAFVLPAAGIRAAARYVPHFFTHQEITAFFVACDKLQPRGAAQARHLVLPVFFRLLYCCGLRTGEARTLRVEQVDLEASHIDIMRSKGLQKSQTSGAGRRSGSAPSICRTSVRDISRENLLFPDNEIGLLQRRQRSSSIQPHLEGGGPWERDAATDRVRMTSGTTLRSAI